MANRVVGSGSIVLPVTPTGQVLSDSGTWITPPGGAPSGAAGGVLSGSYPDPGFAVDMATQAELDAVASAKQSTSEKGAASGYASLDAGVKVPIAQVPTGSTTGTVCAGDDARLSDARAPTAHAHPTSDVTGLDTALSGKAATAHTHAIADTTGLQTAIDGKAATGHAHTGTYDPAGTGATEAAAAVATHAAAADPHTGYQKESEKAQANGYASLGADGLVPAAQLPTSSGGPPTGSMVVWPKGTPPTGWLLCDGQAVSRSTYAALFTALGTTYGAGDGSTTFNLPNLKGRVPVALDAAQAEFDALGETGGEKTHTLLGSEMPSHTHVQDAHGHGVTDPTHSHLTQRYPTATGASSGFTADTSMSGTLADNTQPVKAAATGISVDAATAVNQSAGGGGAHQNLQPYLTLAGWIIKS